ncbi:MAG: hypothetical protein LBF88_07170 [Planctomycetaceae bacterium]|jgi:hypothetical protein|nr:hypothetical protein [Planctomycetaceae bacterium]
MFNVDNFTEFNHDVNSDSDFVPQTGQDLHEQLIRKCEIAYAIDSIKITDFLANYPDYYYYYYYYYLHFPKSTDLKRRNLSVFF